MENPRWQVHSAQEYQTIHGPVNSSYLGEDDGEDSVVFQRTLKGAIYHRIETPDGISETPCPAGSALLFGGPQKGSRAVLDGETYSGHWIRFRGAGLRAHWSFLQHQYGGVIALDPSGTTVETITSIIHDYCTKKWVEPLRIYNWTNMLMDELATRSRAKLSPAEVACERITENPFYPWSLKALAIEAGCSREHLSRVFTQLHKVPPASWLRQRRLARIIRLLESTQIPISQISELAGFGSLDSMGRLIQSAHGCSPSHIRNSRKTYTPAKDPTWTHR